MGMIKLNVFGYGNWRGPRSGHPTMCYALVKAYAKKMMLDDFNFKY